METGLWVFYRCSRKIPPRAPLSGWCYVRYVSRRHDTGNCRRTSPLRITWARASPVTGRNTLLRIVSHAIINGLKKWIDVIFSKSSRPSPLVWQPPVAGKRVTRSSRCSSRIDEIVPGEEQWHPSVCSECAGGCGVMVRVMEGERIIERSGQKFRERIACIKKIEGNPLDPVSGGRLCARGQATLQSLYNPDRVTGPMRRSAGTRRSKIRTGFVGRGRR